MILLPQPNVGLYPSSKPWQLFYNEWQMAKQRKTAAFLSEQRPKGDDAKSTQLSTKLYYNSRQLAPAPMHPYFKGFPPATCTCTPFYIKDLLLKILLTCAHTLVPKGLLLQRVAKAKSSPN
jgi:hypothetical protein